MHIKFYDWNASIKYERINWYNSKFDKNGPSMIKITINFTDLALKTLRKNVNIPLPSDNGCMCLHPKEQSRLRLSNDRDHSLIDTIGRALLTLLEVFLSFRCKFVLEITKGMLLSGYILSVRTCICYFSADDYKRRQLMFYTLIT